MQTGVVAQHPSTEGLQQALQRLHRRREADQTHGEAAELAPDEQPVFAEDGNAPQHLQQRADDEFGLGRRAGAGRANDLDAGTRAGLDIDILGPRRQPPHDAQGRRPLQRQRIQRHAGRNDDGARALETFAERVRLLRQLGRIVHGVAGRQPVQHVGVQWFDDQHVHRSRHESVTAPA